MTEQDYLWDGAGSPDPQIAGLEEVLAPLRYRGELPDLPDQAAGGHGFGQVLLAAAIALFVAGAALMSGQAGRTGEQGLARGWAVTRLEGTPRLGARALGADGTLRVGGDWLETDATSSAKIEVADIGRVEVGPDSRVRLLASGRDAHRLELAQGRLVADISAPPRLFFVDTPSAAAVDLGCQYTLIVEPGGRGLLTVSLGFVSFERDGRTSVVSMGAECETRAGVGPGTPYRQDAPEALRAGLVALDFAGGGDAALDQVLEVARPQDAISLWHLLGRVAKAGRGKVYDKLVAGALPPAGVSRAGVLALDPDMLETWRRHLGLGW